MPDRAAYSASKGAVQSLAMAMAADLVREGVRVNSLSPGTVDTPMLQGIIHRSEDPEGRLREYKERQATCRLVDTSEPALAVAYMIHPANKSLTGTTFEIDGGMRMLRTPRG